MHKAKQSRPPTDQRRNRSETPYERTLRHLKDVVGQIAHEIGIVEALANGAFQVAGRAGDDHACCRRLSALTAQIENAAHTAFATAHALNEKISREVD